MTYIDEINHTQTSLTRALFISKHWGCFSRPIKRKDSWDRHMDHSCCEYSTRLGKMQTYIVLYYLLNQLSPVCILTTLSDRIKVIICNLWGSFFCVKHVFFLYFLHWFVSIHSFHWKKTAVLYLMTVSFYFDECFQQNVVFRSDTHCWKFAIYFYTLGPESSK